MQFLLYLVLLIKIIYFVVEYFKNGYTLYLNSGLSSSRNHYGQRVITREADLVTAHEFGHNWGSEHDPDITVSYDLDNINQKHAKIYFGYYAVNI